MGKTVENNDKNNNNNSYSKNLSFRHVSAIISMMSCAFLLDVTSSFKLKSFNYLLICGAETSFPSCSGKNHFKL